MEAMLFDQPPLMTTWESSCQIRNFVRSIEPGAVVYVLGLLGHLFEAGRTREMPEMGVRRLTRAQN
jgi:hypothetical protein